MRTSCGEEKEKWHDSYVAGGFAEDLFEEKMMFFLKINHWASIVPEMKPFVSIVT